MGFLHNLLSIRGRRSKKKPTGHSGAGNGPLIHDLRRQHDVQEATVSRLLRSSSARFAVMGEVDYASLPPLPHPIHRVLQPSTESISSLTAVPQRGTYTVKVLPRTIHSRTEFPNANPDRSLTPQSPQYDPLLHRSKSVPITPRDKTRLLGLRQDPSVASLLDMYDDHGCLDSNVFSNSPTSPDNEGRSQINRGGSTLRQLLGGPLSLSSRHTRNNSPGEGDISWAERCLCESADSSTSSLGVETPDEAFFPDAHFVHNHDNDTTTNSHDVAINNSDSFPAFSSLEVELSMVAEGIPASENSNSNHPYANRNPITPQRASQVFGFLTERKGQTRHQLHNHSEGRSLPVLTASLQSRFSSYSSSAGSHESDIPSSSNTHAKTNIEPHNKTESTIPSGYDNPSLRWPAESNWLEPAPIRTRSRSASTIGFRGELPNGPNLSVVTEPNAQRSRIPRGPCALSQFPPNSTQCIPSEPQYQSHLNSIASAQERPRTLGQTRKSNMAATSAPDLSVSSDDDVLTHIQSRPHRRALSRSSTNLMQASGSHEKVDPTYVAPTTIKPNQPKELGERSRDKENGSGEAILRKLQLSPMTPVRSRPVFRATNALTPSPASSSDLSPEVQQLMADLRTQRMQARERQKKSGKWGSTTSKLKR